MDSKKSRLPTFGSFLRRPGQPERPNAANANAGPPPPATAARATSPQLQPAEAVHTQACDLTGKTKAGRHADARTSRGVQQRSRNGSTALLTSPTPVTPKPPDGVNIVALDSYQSLPVSMETRDDTIKQGVPGTAGADTSSVESGGGDSVVKTSPVRPVPKPIPRPRNLSCIPPPPPRKSSLPHFQEQQQRGAPSHSHVQAEQCFRANNLQGKPMAGAKNSGVKSPASSRPTVGVLVPPYRSRLGNVSRSAINGSFQAKPREMEPAKGTVVSQQAGALCSPATARIANSSVADRTSAAGYGAVETDPNALERTLSPTFNKHETGLDIIAPGKSGLLLSHAGPGTDIGAETANGLCNKDLQFVDTDRHEWAEDTGSLKDTCHVYSPHQAVSPSPIAVNTMSNWSDNSCSSFGDNKLAIIHERQDMVPDDHLPPGISESDYDSLSHQGDDGSVDSSTHKPVPAPRRHVTSQEGFAHGMQEGFAHGMRSPVPMPTNSNNASRESLHSGSIDMCRSGGVRSPTAFSANSVPICGKDLIPQSQSYQDLCSPAGPYPYSGPTTMSAAGSSGCVNYVISSNSTSPSPNSVDLHYGDVFVQSNNVNQGYVRMESPVHSGSWTGRQSPAMSGRSRASPVSAGLVGGPVFFPTTPVRRYSSPSCGVKMAEMRAASKRHAGAKSKSPSPEVQSKGDSRVGYKRSHSHSGVASHTVGSAGQDRVASSPLDNSTTYSSHSRPNSMEFSSRASSSSLDYTTEPLYETIDFDDDCPSLSGSSKGSGSQILQNVLHEHGAANFTIEDQPYSRVKSQHGKAMFMPIPRERSSYPPQGRRLIPPSISSGRRSLPQTPHCHSTANKSMSHVLKGTFSQELVCHGKPPLGTGSPNLSTRRKYQGQFVLGKPQKHDNVSDMRVKVDSDGKAPPCVSSWPQHGEAHEMSHSEQDKLYCHNTLDRTAQEANTSRQVNMCSPSQEPSTPVQLQHDTSKTSNKMPGSSSVTRFQGQQPPHRASQLKFRPSAKNRINCSKSSGGSDAGECIAVPGQEDKYETCINDYLGGSKHSVEGVNRDVRSLDSMPSNMKGTTKSKLEPKPRRNTKPQLALAKDSASCEKPDSKLGRGSEQQNRRPSRSNRPSKKHGASYSKARLQESDSEHSTSCHSSCENLHDPSMTSGSQLSGKPRKPRKQSRKVETTSLSHTSSLSSSRSSLVSNSSASGLVSATSLQGSKRGLPVRKSGLQNGVVNREGKGQTQQPSTAIYRRGTQNTNVGTEDSSSNRSSQSQTSQTSGPPDHSKNIQHINKKSLVNSPKSARKIGCGIPKGSSGSRSALPNPKGVGNKGQVGNVPGKSLAQGASGSENKTVPSSTANRLSDNNVQDNIPQISCRTDLGTTSPPVCKEEHTNLSSGNNAQTSRNSKMAAQPQSPTRTPRVCPPGTKSVIGAPKSSVTPPSKLSPPSSTSKALATSNTSRGSSSIPSSNSKSGRTSGKSTASNNSPDKASVSIQTEASALQSTRGPNVSNKCGIGARSKLVRPQVAATKPVANKNNSGITECGKELSQENPAAKKQSLIQKPRSSSRLVQPKSKLPSPNSKDSSSSPQSPTKLSPQEKDEILANNLNNNETFPQKSIGDKCVVKSLACVEKTASVAVAKCSSAQAINASRTSKVKCGQTMEVSDGPGPISSMTRPSNLAIPGNGSRKPGIPEHRQKKPSVDVNVCDSGKSKETTDNASVIERYLSGPSEVKSPTSPERQLGVNEQTAAIVSDIKTPNKRDISEQFENSSQSDLTGVQPGATKPEGKLRLSSRTPHGKGELEPGKCFENIPQGGNAEKQESPATSSVDRCRQASQSPQSIGMPGRVMHTPANVNTRNQECISTVRADSTQPGVCRRPDSHDGNVIDTCTSVCNTQAVEGQAGMENKSSTSGLNPAFAKQPHDTDVINSGLDHGLPHVITKPSNINGIAMPEIQPIPGTSDKSTVMIEEGLKCDFDPDASRCEGILEGEGVGMQDSAIFSDPGNESPSLLGPQNEKCVPSEHSGDVHVHVDRARLDSHLSQIPPNTPASNHKSQQVTTTTQKCSGVKTAINVCDEISVSNYRNPTLSESLNNRIDPVPGSHLQTDISDSVETKPPFQAVASENMYLETSQRMEMSRDRPSKRGSDRVMQWIKSQEQISAADRVPARLGQLAKYSQVAENNPDWANYRNSPERAHLDPHLRTLRDPVPGASFRGHPQPDVSSGSQKALSACPRDPIQHTCVTNTEPAKNVKPSLHGNTNIVLCKSKITNSDANSAEHMDILRCESEDTLTASDLENIFDNVEKEARRISSDLSRLPSHALQAQSLKHGYSLDSNMFVKDNGKQTVSENAIRHVHSLDSSNFQEGGTCKEIVKTESDDTIKADGSSSEILCRDNNLTANYMPLVQQIKKESSSPENPEIKSDGSRSHSHIYRETHLSSDSPEHSSGCYGGLSGQCGSECDLGLTSHHPGGKVDVLSPLVSESAPPAESNNSRKPLSSHPNSEVTKVGHMAGSLPAETLSQSEDNRNNSDSLVAVSSTGGNVNDKTCSSSNRQVPNVPNLSKSEQEGFLNDSASGHKPISDTHLFNTAASQEGSHMENKHVHPSKCIESAQAMTSDSHCTNSHEGQTDLLFAYDTESDLNTSVSSNDPMFCLGSDSYEIEVDDTLEAFQAGGSSQGSTEPAYEAETSSEGSSCEKAPQQFVSFSQNDSDVPDEEEYDPVPKRTVSSPNLRRKFDKQKKAANASAFLSGTSSLKRTQATSSLNVDVDVEQKVPFKTLGNINKEIASSDTSLRSIEAEEGEVEQDRMVQSDIGEFGGGWSSKDDLSEVEDQGQSRQDEIEEMAKFINRHYSISEEVEEEVVTEEETPTNEKVFCDIQSDVTPTEESLPGFGDEVDGASITRPDSASDDTVHASGIESSNPTSPEPDFDLRSSVVSPDLESVQQGGSFLNLSDGHNSESDSSGVTSMKDDELEILGDSFERRSQMSAPEMGSSTSRFGWQTSSTFKSRTLPLNLFGDRSKLKSGSPQPVRLFGNSSSRGGGVVAKAAAALGGSSQSAIPGPSLISGLRGKAGIARESLLKSFGSKDLPKRSLPVPVATATRGDEGYWTMQSHNDKSRGGFRLRGERKNKV